MKKNVFTLVLMLGLMCMCTNGFADDLRKKVVGKWYNPYTYESTGEMRGFEFKKNGKCKALGIPNMNLSGWEVKGGRLIIKGEYLNPKSGKWENYHTSEKIDRVNADSLYVLSMEKPMKLGFLYMSPKALKKKVVPASKEIHSQTVIKKK